MRFTSNRRTFLQTAAAGAVAASLSAKVAVGNGTKDGVRVALVGCGSRGMHDANNFQGNPGVTIAWVVDPDESRRAAAAKRFDVPTFYMACGTWQREDGMPVHGGRHVPKDMREQT